ncbi:MAG: LysM peptidoglycan-binding domain-containing protein [Faecalibacillus sp.]
MQKIYYEKDIDLSHRLKELISLTVDESIDYKIEDHGVRARGSLIIKGEYLSDENKLFIENIELDVFAEEKKIIDHRDFHLKVEDFDYEITEGNLKVTIEVGVYGVQDGKDRYVTVQDDPIDEIEELSRSLEVNSDKAEEKTNQPLQEKVYETKEKVEKEESDEDTGIYYLYVIGPDDTYSSIADRYQIDEKIIRDYNENMNLVSGQVLIIPYVATKDS